MAGNFNNLLFRRVGRTSWNTQSMVRFLTIHQVSFLIIASKAALESNISGVSSIKLLSRNYTLYYSH